MAAVNDPNVSFQKMSNNKKLGKISMVLGCYKVITYKMFQ